MLIFCFRNMKRLEVFLLPPGWDASPLQGYPSIKFAGTHLYTWVERGPVSVKSLAHELNAQLPARARTQTTRSWGWTNHDALAPPLKRIHVIRLITHLRHVAKARLALRCTNWMGNPLKVCPSGIALLMACWNSSFPAETPVLCSSS